MFCCLLVSNIVSLHGTSSELGLQVIFGYYLLSLIDAHFHICHQFTSFCFTPTSILAEVRCFQFFIATSSALIVIGDPVPMKKNITSGNIYKMEGKTSTQAKDFST